MIRKLFRAAILLTVIYSLLFTLFAPGVFSGFELLNHPSSFNSQLSSTSEDANVGSSVDVDELKSSAGFLFSWENEVFEQVEESVTDFEDQLKFALAAILACLLSISLGRDQTRFIRYSKNFFEDLTDRLHIFHCVYRL
jgi:predicted PurR-regulated permease PerM